MNVFFKKKIIKNESKMANEKSVSAAENNNKTEPGLVDKIIKQIEYYFGDINMSKDKFMQEEIQKDSGCESYF